MNLCRRLTYKLKALFRGKVIERQDLKDEKTEPIEEKPEINPGLNPAGPNQAPLKETPSKEEPSK